MAQRERNDQRMKALETVFVDIMANLDLMKQHFETEGASAQGEKEAPPRPYVQRPISSSATRAQSATNAPMEEDSDLDESEEERRRLAAEEEERRHADIVSEAEEEDDDDYDLDADTEKADYPNPREKSGSPSSKQHRKANDGDEDEDLIVFLN